MYGIAISLRSFQKEHKSRVPYEQYLRLIPIVLMFILLFTLGRNEDITYRGGMLLFDLTVAAVILMSLHPKVGTGILFRFKPLTVIGRRSFILLFMVLTNYCAIPSKNGDCWFK